ncbi:hypothetical protein [Paracoccus hibiscisoli]|uniref:Uncharacterized protein n=1 Tax=Paracoccus hibiscisoli TaxID=2023261 RepID=A0A4U0QVL5_9RHOB|nr:hypothetical protein [Paracoccus hibiscisoli]TJZ86175.1 hypothetical protein FA740_04615 [Paracoccus hibiscisoli]
MNRITPALAGITTALIIAPVAALGAGSLSGFVDQGLAWLAAAIATAAVSAIAAVITRVVGVTLDARARATIETALQRAARLALEWLLAEAADNPLGQRLSTAARSMLPYVDEGARGSLKRFGLDASQTARNHLHDMARAELIKQLGEVAPDKLAQALSQVPGLDVRKP